MGVPYGGEPAGAEAAAQAIAVEHHRRVGPWPLLIACCWPGAGRVFRIGRRSRRPDRGPLRPCLRAPGPDGRSLGAGRIARAHRHLFAASTVFPFASNRSESSYRRRSGHTERFPTPQGASSVSFFDEPEETRTAPRTAPRRRRPTGGGRRPPTTDRQAIRVRRVGLAVVVIIAIILIAVLVNSCETSARNSALKDYNNSVASLNEQSVQTGSNFFSVLSGGTSDPTTLQTRLNQARRRERHPAQQGQGPERPGRGQGRPAVLRLRAAATA